MKCAWFIHVKSKKEDYLMKSKFLVILFAVSVVFAGFGLANAATSQLDNVPGSAAIAYWQADTTGWQTLVSVSEMAGLCGDVHAVIFDSGSQHLIDFNLGLTPLDTAGLVIQATTTGTAYNTGTACSATKPCIAVTRYSAAANSINGSDAIVPNVVANGTVAATGATLQSATNNIGGYPTVGGLAAIPLQLSAAANTAAASVAGDGRFRGYVTFVRDDAGCNAANAPVMNANIPSTTAGAVNQEVLDSIYVRAAYIAPASAEAIGVNGAMLQGFVNLANDGLVDGAATNGTVIETDTERWLDTNFRPAQKTTCALTKGIAAKTTYAAQDFTAASTKNGGASIGFFELLATDNVYIPFGSTVATNAGRYRVICPGGNSVMPVLGSANGLYWARYNLGASATTPTLKSNLILVAPSASTVTTAQISFDAANANMPNVFSRTIPADLVFDDAENMLGPASSPIQSFAEADAIPFLPVNLPSSATVSAGSGGGYLITPPGATAGEALISINTPVFGFVLTEAVGTGLADAYPLVRTAVNQVIGNIVYGQFAVAVNAQVTACLQTVTNYGTAAMSLCDGLAFGPNFTVAPAFGPTSVAATVTTWKMAGLDSDNGTPGTTPASTGTAGAFVSGFNPDTLTTTPDFKCASGGVTAMGGACNNDTATSGTISGIGNSNVPYTSAFVMSPAFIPGNSNNGVAPSGGYSGLSTVQATGCTMKTPAWPTAAGIVTAATPNSAGSALTGANCPAGTIAYYGTSADAKFCFVVCH